jgi:hypothetical protein
MVGTTVIKRPLPRPKYRWENKDDMNLKNNALF